MTARLVKRIVFGYTVDCFPGLLIVGCNQLKRKVERAGFEIAVSMEPLTGLPPDTDILLAPAELKEAARDAAPALCRVESLDDFLNHPIYNTLIDQIKEGREWTAKRSSEQAADEDEGRIVTYRGYERIG